MFRVHSNRNVRRVFAVALTLVVLGAVLLASSDAWPLGQAGAASTTCIWTKHTKRVVSHVKRHGKVKRVVRIKHYRTCRKVAVREPTPTTTTPAPTPTPTPSSEPAPTPTPEPEPNALGVVARDANKHFIFEPSRTTVKSGRLTVQLINEGEDPHTMDVQRIGPGGTPEGEVVEIPETASKHQSAETFGVQPGRYRMWCTLFHHAEEGMETEITVE
jgi:plastocyanin